MLLQQKSATLYRELNRELLNFRPGSRFYSARQLVLRYGISRRVVVAALRELESRGTIEIRPQSGVFVRQSGARKRVILYVPDWPSESIKSIEEALRQEFDALENVYDFQAMRYNYLADLNELIASGPADISIVPWHNANLSKEELLKLLALEKPTVVLWSALSSVSIHSARSAGEYGGMLAAGHLLRNGHRKLALLPSEPRTPEVMFRLHGFLDTAQIFGAQTVIIDCPVTIGDFSTTRAHDALEAHLEKFGCNFTGLFVVSDESAQGAVVALHQYGLRIPEDVSLIGYGNVLNSNYFTPPLTTIDGQRGELAKQLVMAIDKLLSGRSNKVIDIRIKPILIERASVCAIPKDQRKD